MLQEFIVKIQRPLTTSHPDDARALVYNKDKSLFAEFPLHMLQRLFGGTEHKIFHYATLEAGQLAIEKRAPYQSW